MCDSCRTTVVLMALKSSSTSFFCSSFKVGSSRHNAQQPSPTIAGVLGMMTTAGQVSPLYVLMRRRDTPAARETSSLPSRCGAIFSTTPCTCCGFTAMRMTSACCATSISSSHALRPQRSCSASVAAWQGSKPMTCHFSSLATPLKMAPPILPQPILPNVNIKTPLLLCYREISIPSSSIVPTAQGTTATINGFQF